MPRRALAVAETIAATALVVLAYKAAKLVEPAGWNHAPGIVMALATLALHRIHGAGGLEFGVVTQRWKPAAILAVLGLVAVAFASGAALGAGVEPAAVGRVVLQRLLFAGVCEELFFRGYVQSRLDAVLGRPAPVLGAQVGGGLVVSALLFGAIHVLNPARVFAGPWELAWGSGAGSFASGLVFGWLRARTGNIWPGVVLHGTSGAVRTLLAAARP